MAESARVLAVRGKVLPATLHDVHLEADIQVDEQGKEVRVQGESQIPRAAGRIRRVWLEPAHTRAYPPAVQAILTADLVLVGPGSLYTSILPDLLVPDICEALRVSRAIKFYVCNVATQPGETDGFTAYDHLRTIEKHVGGGLFDLVLCNNRMEGKLPPGVDWVHPTSQLQDEYPTYLGNFMDEEQPHRHDSIKLAQTVMDLYNERTGPTAKSENLDIPTVG